MEVVGKRKEGNNRIKRSDGGVQGTADLKKEHCYLVRNERYEPLSTMCSVNCVINDNTWVVGI